MKRLVKIGEFETGKLNNICDVKGVLVGHSTVEEGPFHTGVTAILPHSGNIFIQRRHSLHQGGGSGREHSSG